MNTRLLKGLYKKAEDFVKEDFPEDYRNSVSVNLNTLKNMKSKTFISHYCWVVYAAGFKEAVLNEMFPRLKEAYKDFDIEKIVRMRSLEKVYSVNSHESKAHSFIEGVKLIHREGFSNFKKRMLLEGIDSLKDLPYIGDITKKHLAKNIGLADVAKNDIWLERIKSYVNANSVDELIHFIQEEFDVSANTADVVLWRYCAENNDALKD